MNELHCPAKLEDYAAPQPALLEPSLLRSESAYSTDTVSFHKPPGLPAQSSWLWFGAMCGWRYALSVSCLVNACNASAAARLGTKDLYKGSMHACTLHLPCKLFFPRPRPPNVIASVQFVFLIAD